MNNSNPGCFRYSFAPEVTHAISEFSRLNLTKPRKEFQLEWKQWLSNNRTMVDADIRRIHNLGFTGNVEDKMYQSARNYFRKKICRELKVSHKSIVGADLSALTINSNDKKLSPTLASPPNASNGSTETASRPDKQKKRKDRNVTSKHIMDLMYEHVHILKNEGLTHLKPSEKFSRFLKAYPEQMACEINLHCGINNESTYDCMLRIKSGYKAISRYRSDNNYLSQRKMKNLTEFAAGPAHKAGHVSSVIGSTSDASDDSTIGGYSDNGASDAELEADRQMENEIEHMRRLNGEFLEDDFDERDAEIEATRQMEDETRYLRCNY